MRNDVFINIVYIHIPYMRHKKLWGLTVCGIIIVLDPNRNRNKNCSAALENVDQNTNPNTKTWPMATGTM
jgi:hypothetical protein